jgi:DNA-binding transcriptional MerR regulator
MKLHGFNDSERKTSCQQLFMEFVSLMSFNGHMLYPHIKKSKEINLNLPCTGYKYDCEASLSRVGECARMGCNLSFCFLFQKIHLYCLREAYSLLPGMINDFHGNYLEMPIELYGCPEEYPLFSLLCKGNTNNYRLYKYGDKNTKDIIKTLYYINMNPQDTEMSIDRERMDEYTHSLYHPRFYYEKNNNALKLLTTKLSLTKEEMKLFWSENASYRFIKPRNNKMLIKWCEAMFFNRGFTEAYTKMSRTKMTLRLSTYASSKCIKYWLDEDDESLLSLHNSYNGLMKKIPNYTDKIDDIGDKALERSITSGDSTTSAIYSIINNMLYVGSEEPVQPTVATMTPMRITWFTVENDPGLLLQYYFNKDNFELDKRIPVTPLSLGMDIQKLKKNISMPSEDCKDPMVILSVFDDIVNCKPKPIVMMGYNRGKNTLFNTVIGLVENSIHPRYKYKINTSGISEVTNPLTGENFYLKGTTPKNSINTQIIDSLAWLYVYLHQVLYYPKNEIKKVFLKQYFKELN